MNMSLNEEELVRARPLLFEGRPFTRISKRNVAVQASTSTDTHSAEIDLDFNYFISALTRTQLLLNTNAREIARYAAEKSTIETRSEEAKALITELRTQLDRSKKEKQNRLEYDDIAADILSFKTLRAREEQHSNISRLNAEIHALERERDEYSHVWAQRRAQFEEIVKQLEVMSAQIKEDKDEQDRREGMSEEEEEGEEGEVPAGKSTPAHSHGDGSLQVPGHGRLTPNVSAGGGATPQPVDEKEEGEEDEDDVEITDAPPLRSGKADDKTGDRMDTS